MMIPEMIKVPTVAESRKSEIDNLADAIRDQTKSINHLCEMNMQILQALLEDDGEEQEKPRNYMDGSPIG